MIIHIAGASGAGKTTLGKKLKEKFGDKITVKDIDNLRMEFIKSHYGDTKWDVIDKDAYQAYIDRFVEEQKKPLIFVGLNHMPWWHENHYYNMHSVYNYFIDIDDMTVTKQKCLRLMEDLKDISNDKEAMRDLVEDNKKFIKITQERIAEECGAEEIIKMNAKWRIDYKKQKYIFMSRDNIFDEVVKLIDNQKGGSYYSKYIKYRNKYIELKNM